MGYGCCSSDYGYSRNYLTKEEKIEMLKEYQENLEKEVQGVKERIEQIRKSEKNN